MEYGEDEKLFRMVEVHPVEIKCAECNNVIGEALEEVVVYCEDCFNEIKTKMENFEGKMGEIRELVEGE